MLYLFILLLLFFFLISRSITKPKMRTRRKIQDLEYTEDIKLSDLPRLDKYEDGLMLRKDIKQDQKITMSVAKPIGFWTRYVQATKVLARKYLNFDIGGKK